MGYPDIFNKKPCTLDLLFLADEDGREVFVPRVCASFEIREELVESVPQRSPPVAGEPATAAEVSSYRYEAEIAFTKKATDIILVGHAQSAQAVQKLQVGVKVGGVQKVATVFGDRYWVKKDGNIYATRPKFFQEIPLIYERAFGGWDRADIDEANWRVEPRNPVGTGFGDPLRFIEEGRVRMPNIEDPNHLICRYGDSPPPIGFGFISPEWQPRTLYAGTYDEEWDTNRKPLLPEDFDRRFFNAASPGLIASGFLRGDEDVTVVNASPVPRLKFRLPGIPPPVCKIALRRGRIEFLHTNLDTVIINTDEMMLFMLWRSYLHVPNGVHDLVSIEVTTDQETQAAAAG